MKRNAKLAYGGSADSKVGITRRKPLKRGRRKPRPSLTGFHAAVCADGWCALDYLGGCQGRLWGHHFIPKQRYRDNPAATVDPRVGVPLCVAHHAAVEAGRAKCARPPELDEFLADFGLIEREAKAA